MASLIHVGMTTLSKIRTCPLCDAFTVRCSSLCKHCEDLLLVEMQSTPRGSIDVEGLSVFPLFHWKAGQSFGIVGELLYALKGGDLPTLSSWLAERLFLLHPALGNLPTSLFLPAPALRFGTSDHARVWARALKETSPHPGTLFSPLARQESRQKTKDLDQRRRVQVSWAQKPLRNQRALLSQRPVVFCDDVVTSGNTMKACHRALGEPENFICFSIAYRARN